MFTPKADTINEACGSLQTHRNTRSRNMRLTGCLINFLRRRGEQIESSRAYRRSWRDLCKTACTPRKRLYEGYAGASLRGFSTKRRRYLKTFRVWLITERASHFVQLCEVARSGVIARNASETLVREWFEIAQGGTIFKQSIGASPSFADVLKMVTQTRDAERSSLGYFIGRGRTRISGRKSSKRLNDSKTAIRWNSRSSLQMLTACRFREEWRNSHERAWQMTEWISTLSSVPEFSKSWNVYCCHRLRDRDAINARKFSVSVLSLHGASTTARFRSDYEALQDAMEWRRKMCRKSKEKFTFSPTFRVHARL